jgi:ABC-2 type transport system permease protein
LGSALYLTIAGLLGLGIGGILRSTAAAVASLAGILFVLPTLVDVLPAGISNVISRISRATQGRRS